MKFNWGYFAPTSVRLKALEPGADPTVLSAHLAEMKRHHDEAGKLSKLTLRIEVKDNKGCVIEYSYALNPHEVGEYLISELSLHEILNRMVDQAWGKHKKCHPQMPDEVLHFEAPEMKEVEENIAPPPPVKPFPLKWERMKFHLLTVALIVLGILQLKSCISK